jgi:UPF0271 protein
MRMDLNADVGEGLDDAPLIPHLTSVNVACGAHAGDRASIDAAIATARAHQVAVGAHPSYPDREGFGRAPMQLAAPELEHVLAGQIALVWQAARAQGVALRHVKPHGAVYHAASVDLEVAGAVVGATRRVDPSLILVGPPGSLLLALARAEGLACASEGFADRRYLGSGELVPRSGPDALLTSVVDAADQAVQIALTGTVTTVDGGRIPVRAQTLCIHGDTPNAAGLAKQVRSALEGAGIELAPLDRARL